MSKISKASDDVINLVQKIVDDMGMTLYVHFFALNIRGQKELVKISKASATTEYFSKTVDSIIVYVNEEIYDMLEERQRYILIANALYGVNYDGEKDVLNVTQPELSISVAGYQQYGSELVNASEAVQLALQQIKEKKDAEKAEKKKNGKKND